MNKNNLDTLVLEIRDSKTFISVLAIRTDPKNNTQFYYLKDRCGYSNTSVILMNLDTAKSENNSYKWNDRTMQTAHEYIQVNFELLKDGDVIDIEYILHESDTKKTSERFRSLDKYFKE